MLFGLGIRHVGKTVAQLLARRFGTLDALAAATAEEVAAVNGVGPTIADAVVEFFANRSNAALIERLREAGLDFTEPRAAAATGPMAGQTVVLTGTLQSLSRGEATALIEAAGPGERSVSKKTSLVVAGAEAGGKLEKAQALGLHRDRRGGATARRERSLSFPACLPCSRFPA
ncbi:MAG: helix-hairpin-helix domain-containing protein [Gemmatimonadales bacterium]